MKMLLNQLIMLQYYIRKAKPKSLYEVQLVEQLQQDIEGYIRMIKNIC